MSKDAIAFHRWMIANDTPDNAEKYFHYSDEDMYNEFKKNQNQNKDENITKNSMVNQKVEFNNKTI